MSLNHFRAAHSNGSPSRANWTAAEGDRAPVFLLPSHDMGPEGVDRRGDRPRMASKSEELLSRLIQAKHSAPRRLRVLKAERNTPTQKARDREIHLYLLKSP